jgi:hypothetical protein
MACFLIYVATNAIQFFRNTWLFFENFPYHMLYLKGMYGWKNIWPISSTKFSMTENAIDISKLI